MCKFFSSVSNGDGNLMYFNALQRKDVKLKKKYESFDSHTSIADHYGYVGKKEDVLNKYEYNPLTKLFTVDQLNNEVDDSKLIEKFCLELDFKSVVPELIIKPIFNPIIGGSDQSVSPEHLILLKQWDSVWASVKDSVGDSVRDSVWASVWASVWDSVGDSVWASVRDSVGDSVRASVWASVWAYQSSFFNLQKWQYIKHKKGCNPFQSCIDLWDAGLVPSYDGTNWRLHGVDGLRPKRGHMTLKDFKVGQYCQDGETVYKVVGGKRLGLSYHIVDEYTDEDTTLPKVTDADALNTNY
jgi:hypothetical protein